MAFSALLGAGLAGGAQAGILFDPTGTGATGVDIGGFDWIQSAYLARGGNEAIANRLAGNCANGGCDFNVYTQARAATALDQDGNPLVLPGLNQSYEITITLGYTQTVTSASVAPGFAQFETVPSSESFVQIYLDSARNSNPLEGFGFNDGNLILTGVGLEDIVGGIFALSSNTPRPLDRFGTDNFPGQSTLPGSGGSESFVIGVGDSIADPNFFRNVGPDGLDFQLNLRVADIGQSLPFRTIDPMDCFISERNPAAVGTVVAASGCRPNDHVAGPYSAQPPAAAPGYLPVVGLVNGSRGPQGGPDFVAQSDYNSRFDRVSIGPQPVPEPDTLAMLGLGLGLFGIVRRKRR